MSSYDCVLPIDEAELRAVARISGASVDLPIGSSVLRSFGRDDAYRIVDAIRAAAAVVSPVSTDPFYGSLHDRPDVAAPGPRTGSASTAWR